MISLVLDHGLGLLDVHKDVLSSPILWFVAQKTYKGESTKYLGLFPFLVFYLEL